MRNRWFHRPLLHTEHDAGKRVSWLELFYDLIFVAGIIQLGDTLSQHLATYGVFTAFFWFALHFTPLWVSWTGFTFYANRFDVDDIIHRTLVFAHMFTLGAMAVTAPVAIEPGGDPRPFELAFIVSQLLIVGMYYRSWKHTPDARPYSRYWGGVFALGAGLWIVGLLLPTPWNYALWAVSIAVILYSPTSAQSRAINEAYPLDMEHLAERYGLLTLIVLGESFVKVLGFLSEDHHGVEAVYLLKGAWVLLITCGVWWIYFDDVAGAELKKTRMGFVLWLYGHWPLALFLTGVGVAVKYAVKIDPFEPTPETYRWLLGGNLAATFATVAMIDSVTVRKNTELSDAWRVRIRLLSAVLLMLLAAVGNAMPGGLFLGLCTLVCVAQVAIDMMMAPTEAVSHHPEAVSTAELARRRRDGSAAHLQPSQRRELGDAVRKGTPAELRRDLYFFLMEGGWTRILVVLLVAYLGSNVLFAGLYLLVDGSISGTQSFADAFAFSVQTMSTIGYGTMSPANGWADFIVTIEAAFGMLGVALATGLMFAKASRPVSKVLFSQPMVLTTWDGRPTLVFRVGNARGNEIVEANMAVSVLRDEISPEGHHMRRLHDLALTRARTPVFRLSWVVTHTIDASSPLRDVDWEHPERQIGAVIATLMGHDATYAQMTHARHTYYPEDIRVGHRFVDVMSELPDGRLMIDYDLFHDTVPDELPPSVARDTEATSTTSPATGGSAAAADVDSGSSAS